MFKKYRRSFEESLTSRHKHSELKIHKETKQFVIYKNWILLNHLSLCILTEVLKDHNNSL